MHLQLLQKIYFEGGDEYEVRIQDTALHLSPLPIMYHVFSHKILTVFQDGFETDPSITVRR